MTDDRKRKRIGAWCIETYDHLKTGPYLQIDLGEQKSIQFIATQGKWGRRMFLTPARDQFCVAEN